MTPPIEASSSDEGQVASEQAIVCGAHLPGRSPALWAGSVTLSPNSRSLCHQNPKKTTITLSHKPIVLNPYSFLPVVVRPLSVDNALRCPTDRTAYNKQKFKFE
jgi:hypothetical protein